MKLAFDIGANIGQSADALLGEGYDSIVCVEPIPALARELEKKFSHLPDVFVENKAVCDKEEAQHLYIHHASTGLSTIQDEWLTASRFTRTHPGWNPPISVIGVTLDVLIEKYGMPTFIKIDAEGAEKRIFQGLSECDAKIAFEWTEEVWDTVCLPAVELLKKLGYTLFAYHEYPNGSNTDTYTRDEALFPEPSDVSYTAWDQCAIHKIIQPSRQQKYGMLWAKK